MAKASVGSQDDIPFTAIALDGRVDLKEASTRLGWRKVKEQAYGVVLEREGQGLLHLFSFGAIVQEGCALLEPKLLGQVEEATGRKSLRQTEETYYVVLDPKYEGGRLRVGWDRVVIPSQEPELIAAVALLLGQSAALERYEKASDELIEETLPATRQLALGGQLGLGSGVQVKRIGRLATDRLELASLFYLLDRPEQTWEDPKVAELYDALFSNLELAERHEATLNKLEAVEKVTDLTLNLWLGHLSNRLEWTIVGLIVLEIVLALLKLV